MGDRAVTGFTTGKDENILYLYSHWGAGVQVMDLWKALKMCESRWSDPDYATRYCVSSMIADHESLTGHGLSINRYAMPDTNNILIVNWGTHEVNVVEEGSKAVVKSIPFPEFVSNMAYGFTGYVDEIV